MRMRGNELSYAHSNLIRCEEVLLGKAQNKDLFSLSKITPSTMIHLDTNITLCMYSFRGAYCKLNGNKYFFWLEGSSLGALFSLGLVEGLGLCSGLPLSTELTLLKNSVFHSHNH